MAKGQMMTRKDYVLIAQAIKWEHDTPGIDGERERAIVERAQFNMASTIANALRTDNPRFDRERFMQACGFEG